MKLEIGEREIEGIAVLDLKGPLTFGPSDLELREKLAALHQLGKINIILNLKDLTDVDSTGLGTLVFALARLRKAGGKLALANVSKAHLRIFLLTRLALTFEFFQDEHDAVNSFFPDRELRHFDVLNFVEHEGDRDPGCDAGSDTNC